MSELLLDTHVWFWYLTGSKRLGRKLRHAVDSSLDGLWLSPVSIWELGMLARKERIRITGDYRAWVTRAMEAMPVRIAPLDAHIALTSLEIDLPHSDPADRFLAATAQVHGLTLATADARLRKLGWLSTVGD
jgi:PIN domain nuclease of toxin-antitoxin system